MSAFVSEIRALATFITPKGWLKCEGQELLIENYPDLFSVIGINYGGNGTTTFNIPNLVGRSILGQDGGVNYSLGSTGGSAKQTLLDKNLPAHSHDLKVSNLPGDISEPNAGCSFSSVMDLNSDYSFGFKTAIPNIVMNAETVQETGEGVEFSILSPYLAMNYFISLYGVLPVAEVV